MRSLKSELPVLVALAAAFCAVVAVATGTISAQASLQAAEVSVQITEGTLDDIDSWVFEPSVVEVHVGDTIVWTNMGTIEHNATARAFDSGILAPGASFSWTATQAGTISYVCDFHPWMAGTIVVAD